MMAARRCDDCVIQYPTSHIRCSVCESLTTLLPHATPDMNWQSKVELLNLAAAPAPAIPAAGCNPVRDEHGRLWLYEEHLKAGGWRASVPSFQLFRTSEGVIIEVQGADLPRGRYLVEVV